jgi:hypothetical protein
MEDRTTPAVLYQDIAHLSDCNADRPFIVWHQSHQEERGMRYVNWGASF